jgi:hypothetical protein
MTADELQPLLVTLGHTMPEQLTTTQRTLTGLLCVVEPDQPETDHAA